MCTIVISCRKEEGIKWKRMALIMYKWEGWDKAVGNKLLKKGEKVKWCITIQSISYEG